MSLATELLEVAQGLLGAKRSRPRNAAIRRAISTAYYALFHQLIDASVTRLVPEDEQQAILARMFEHNRMKVLCQRVVILTNAKRAPDKNNAQLHPIVTFVGHPVAEELREVADAFQTLQERRLEADYNRRAERMTRTDAETMIESARKAFEALRSVEKTPAGQAFLLLLFVGEPKGR